ncbi:MAG: hypothetical protein IJA34_05665 [Lachnospiraceae bacterium]|nr:hypothetical protein [Lachnospiraceae bacterium]
MRKKVKVLMVAMCLSAFGLMALGSTSSDSGEGKEIVGDNSESKKELVTIENQVILDNSGIKVTAEEYVDDSIWGEGIKLLVENNSDKDVTVGCKALIVNNYMISDLFVADVASGKKSNETMYLSSSALKAAGIETVGQVEIYFHVYDSASYDTIFDSDCVTIKTSAFENMDTTPDDAGTELYNAGGIRIVGKTVDEDSFWGSAILLYCENTTDKNVGITVEDMSINGFMMEPLFSETVYSGKMAIGDITIFESDLEDNGIETIQDVELKFHIYDADSFSTIADSDTVKFTAQ